MAFRDVNCRIRLVARVLATGEFPVAVTDDTLAPTPAERVSLALQAVRTVQPASGAWGQGATTEVPTSMRPERAALFLVVLSITSRPRPAGNSQW
jgi:hypothetical protein